MNATDTLGLEEARLLLRVSRDCLLRRARAGKVPGAKIDGRVNYISTGGDTWFAATSQGVYRSVNHGETWEGPVLTAADYNYVGASGELAIAARRQDMETSSDQVFKLTYLMYPYLDCSNILSRLS